MPAIKAFTNRGLLVFGFLSVGQAAEIERGHNSRIWGEYLTRWLSWVHCKDRGELGVVHGRRAFPADVCPLSHTGMGAMVAMPSLPYLCRPVNSVLAVRPS